MEEAEAKIGVLEAQLRQVTAILESDAHNEQFLKLRSDLQKLIELTNKLTEVTAPDRNAEVSQVPAPSPSPVPASADAEDSDDELENVFQTTQEENSAPSGVLHVVSTGALQVGDNVAVTSAETPRPFAAVIMSLPDNDHCTVKYFEYFDNAEVTLPIASVAHLSSVASNPKIPRSDQIEPDLRCRCRYSADQVTYEAVIDKAVTGMHLPSGSNHRGSSFAVTFVGYGNSEIVPIEYIQLLEGEPEAASARAAPAAKSADGLDALIVIPENLKIKPADSEEEKLRKKKKIKAIKSRNRLISKGNEQTEVKNTWQKFIKKVCFMLSDTVPCLLRLLMLSILMLCVVLCYTALRCAAL